MTAGNDEHSGGNGESEEQEFKGDLDEEDTGDDMKAFLAESIAEAFESGENASTEDGEDGEEEEPEGTDFGWLSF